MGAPDLERATGAYRIALSYRPTLEAPREARVTVTRVDGTGRLERVDALTVDAPRGYDVYAHTAVYSAPFATSLEAR